MAEDDQAAAARLVGAWTLDRFDEVGRAEFGDIRFEFHRDGALNYVIRMPGKKEIFKLVWRVEDAFIVTDQPSAPSVERTSFSFEDDGTLRLALGGTPYRLVRDD